jgi:hypothetical protein
MNEQLFGKKVRQVLNGGSLGPQAQARLRASREAALARHRAERSPALAWAGNVRGFGGWPAYALAALVALAVLAAAAVGVHNWQQNQRIAELAELDVQLLTDDLPIDAYLDRGFHNWLKQRQRSAEE